MTYHLLFIVFVQSTDNYFDRPIPRLQTNPSQYAKKKNNLKVKVAVRLPEFIRVAYIDTRSYNLRWNGADNLYEQILCVIRRIGYDD